MLEKRVKDLERICKVPLPPPLPSCPRPLRSPSWTPCSARMDKLPYGLRWICKMMRALCEKQLPGASKEDVLRLTGYFVYYRFINVALVSPEAFKIVPRELGTRDRKNLLVVAPTAAARPR